MLKFRKNKLLSIFLALLMTVSTFVATVPVSSANETSVQTGVAYLIKSKYDRRFIGRNGTTVRMES